MSPGTDDATDYDRITARDIADLLRHLADMRCAAATPSTDPADRAGIVTSFAAGAPDRTSVAEGAPLGVLVAQAEQSALRNFLALPARYAGGVRPAIALKGARAGQTLTLFAEGRAGIVSGYFGLLSAAGVQAAAVPGKGALPAAALGRSEYGRAAMPPM